jgi:peptidoglycan/xylan/chitin deacetylase (PgdA/CDA1 family)
MSYYDNQIYIQGKEFLYIALLRSGLCAVSRRRYRNSVLVLTYHDVLPSGFPEDNVLFGMTVNTEEFEWQLDHIKAHYTPIGLEQFLSWIAGSGSLPPRPVLITFDDGHTNNLHYALPALKKRDMPAVFFVVAGNLGERHLVWVEEGYGRLMAATGQSWVSLDGQHHALNTIQERATACSYFFRLFQAFSEDAQQREMESLRQQLPFELDGSQFPTRFEFLSPAELRALSENKIAIGAHSMTHPVLSTLNSERAREEIAESKTRLEQAIGVPVQAFAYPFGQPVLDFGEREKEYLKEAGFRVAFSGATGFVNRDHDLFSLPRIGIGRVSRAQFIANISGTLSTLKHMLGRQ